MSWYSRVGAFLSIIDLHDGSNRVSSKNRLRRHGRRCKPGNAGSHQRERRHRPSGSHTFHSRNGCRKGSSDGFNSIQIPGLTPMDIVGNPDLLGAGSLVAVPDVTPRSWPSFKRTSGRSPISRYSPTRESTAAIAPRTSSSLSIRRFTARVRFTPPMSPSWKRSAAPRDSTSFAWRFTRSRWRWEKIPCESRPIS